MKKLLYRIIVLMVVAAASCMAVVSCGSARRLTVMTYNVGVFSKYSGDSMGDVADIILTCDADAVALNELDSCNRRHAAYQLRDLSDSLGGWEYAFAGAFPFAGGSYGNGVVTRDPVVARYRVSLPKGGGREPRSMAVVETPRYVIASVHLDFSAEEVRLSQIGTLNEWIDARYRDSARPVLLCGDFNALPDSGSMQHMSERWELLSGMGLTYPSKGPVKCIDYVWHLRSSAPVRVIDCRVVEEAGEASDHLPVLVRLSLK